ncbi:MAG: chemotaxis protein CheW [Candidatus Cloacimonetes bacterium]|nr:chemotaxis protein CheW [Candidatus Cloacimonadota bacterium]
MKILEFRCDKLLFGISLQLIRKIISEPELIDPGGAPPFVRGIFRERNRVYTLLDISLYLTGIPAENGRCVLLKTSSDLDNEPFEQTWDTMLQLAFQVQEVGDISEMEEEELRPAEDNVAGIPADLIKGIGNNSDGEKLFVLDAQELLQKLLEFANHG